MLETPIITMPSQYQVPVVQFLLLLAIAPGLLVHSSSKIAASDGSIGQIDSETAGPPPVSNAICRLPRERGSACNNGTGNFTGTNSAGIKWYFDADAMQCLAFGFRGCGGNDNRFDDIFVCRRVCHPPADYGGCSGMKPAAKNAQGQQIYCSGLHLQQEKCPPGYRCQNLAFYGICCDVQNEEMYTRNYRPKCANGKAPLQHFDRVNNWPVMHLGKSCEDEFCPVGTDCIGQEVFAHCCPK